MVVMFVGCLVLGKDPNIILFLPLKTTEQEFFVSTQTKKVVKLLKEGVSPYHGRAFPVPKIRKDTIMKEVERLCTLGVLKRQPASEWALPSFIIPKKDRTLCFLSDFWEVNKRLVRTPFSIPKISMVMQEIEGFSYATALDLNMS